ncbi:hypothetical protein OEB99_19140 [Actinotalea sp. M2MS4P-6]|uniref:hypothetical protein n=1 Tax=Actinotalea sp. M2MS4P-6 TaxID=2983762 RepID=UPI0021E46959|nr:hypothetical protein [Actinotalea sp. M2MS4P-6]MCV2396432.1 hypothetical protein [Actinotalea sp. M2MS4P-6]
MTSSDDESRVVAGPSSASTTSSGPGRALVLVYGILAVAATARSGVQLATKYDEAPLAYLLSAVAAVVYVVATIALAKGRGVWRRVAWVAVSVELVGVLTVGTLSLVRSDLFADATVWSDYGQGYGYVPLVLPVLGLWWLRRTGRTSSGQDAVPR